jgi:hypothetical protein
MNDDKLTELAARVLVYAKSEDKNFGVDPMILITIFKIIFTLIRLLYRCGSNEESIKSSIKRPGFIARFVMKRVIAKRLPFRERKAAFNALLNVSEKLSEKELTEAISSYHSFKKNL